MIEYAVRDASGELVATHVRRDAPDGTKTMFWRLAGGTNGLNGVHVADLPLYGIERDLGRSVVVTEGEKAADALLAAGIAAVGTVTGSSSAPSAAALAELAGKHVYLWPDADDVGRRHMEKIVGRLSPIATSVRWIEPGTERAKGWDAADALAELGVDGTREMIREAVDAREFLAADFLSSGVDVPSERKQMPFLSARDFAAQVGEDVEWIARRWVAKGAITELDGRPKAAGKTTFLSHLIAAALDGSKFLGARVARTPVVMLTEQSPASLRPMLERAGLAERDDLYILPWRDTRGVSWPAVMEAAVEQCRTVGAALLIVDTLPQFARLAGDSENDAGAALEAMAPVQAAATDGLAVVISRHDRKGGGEVGESGRGSSAFAGAVDIILALRRGDGESRPTIRHLHALSRFDETPEELVIELTDAGYVALGSAVNFAVEEAKAAILAAIGEEPLTTAMLVEATGLKRTTIYAAISELDDGGKVTRVGKGTRGDPYRFLGVAYFRPDPIPDVIGPDERNGANVDLSFDMVSEARRTFGDMLQPAVPTDTSAMVPRLDA